MGNWRNLVFSKLTCRFGREDIEPHRFREGLERLTIIRPQIYISMRNQFRQSLVSWDHSASLDYIAPPRQFEKLTAFVYDTDSDDGH